MFLYKHFNELIPFLVFFVSSSDCIIFVDLIYEANQYYKNFKREYNETKYIDFEQYHQFSLETMPSSDMIIYLKLIPKS